MLRTVLALAVVGVVFVGILPRVADLSQAGRQMGSMGGIDIATLGVVAVAGLVIYAFVLTAAMPGLSMFQAFVVNQSSTTVANTMPAGGVLGVGVSYRFYGSWGHSRSAITLNVLLTGIGNFMCKLGFPIVALALLAISGNASLGLLVAAIVGLVAFSAIFTAGALGLASERLAQRVGQFVGAGVTRVRGWLRRPAVADAAAVRGGLPAPVDRPAAQPRPPALRRHRPLPRDPVRAAARRAAGRWRHCRRGELGGGAGRLLHREPARRAPLTPGGIGLVELGLTAALIAAGAPNTEAVAAVLVYRTVSYLLPLPLGAVTYLVWRWNARWRCPAEPAGVELAGAP